MTTPNPTPTTREREAMLVSVDNVKTLLWFWRERLPIKFSSDLEREINEIKSEYAAALARERREALTEAAAIASNNKDSVFPQDSIATEIELLRDGK